MKKHTKHVLLSSGAGAVVLGVGILGFRAYRGRQALAQETTTPGSATRTSSSAATSSASSAVSSVSVPGPSVSAHSSARSSSSLSASSTVLASDSQTSGAPYNPSHPVTTSNAALSNAVSVTQYEANPQAGETYTFTSNGETYQVAPTVAQAAVAQDQLSALKQDLQSSDPQVRLTAQQYATDNNLLGY